jgi:hypothetical protein
LRKKKKYQNLDFGSKSDIKAAISNLGNGWFEKYSFDKHKKYSKVDYYYAFLIVLPYIKELD